MVPSISEGFGLVILEAFNEDVPVVAFDVPACNEIIDNNVSGVLVSPFDVRELADEAIRILEDQSFRSQIAYNAKKTITSRFSLSQMTEKIIDVYKKQSTTLSTDN